MLWLLAVLLCPGCAAAEDRAAEPQAEPAVEASATSRESDPQQGAAQAEIAALRARVAAEPQDDAARRRLAIALHGANLRDEAVEQFELLADKDPNPRSLLELALAYGTAARMNDAEATYRRLLALVPNHPIALHNLGNLAYKRGQNDVAIELYGQAIAAKPDYLLALYHLAQALEMVERYRDAYRTYESVLGLEPRTPEELTAFDDALYHLAALDIKMGAYERAGQMLAELLRANPEHPSAYYAYGQVLLQLGRPEEARGAFEAHMRVLAKQKPTGPAAHGE